MKINKILYVLFFPVIAQLIFSCCCCDDDFILPVQLQVADMELYPVDNSGGYPIVVTNSDTVPSIHKNAFGIQLELIYDEYATVSCSPQKHWTMFNTATACSCNDYPEFQETVVLKDFTIVTLNDFDSSKLAGTDLTAYFQFLQGDYFSEINQDSLAVSSWDNLLMVMLQQPKIDSVFQFEVSFEVNDSLQLKDTLRQVKLL